MAFNTKNAINGTWGSLWINDREVGEGKLVIFKQSGQYRIARGVNSLTTTSDVKGEAFQKIKLVDIMDLMTNDIRQTCHRSYIGKYANSYDNKCILMTAIQGYLDQLVLSINPSRTN